MTWGRAKPPGVVAKGPGCLRCGLIASLFPRPRSGEVGGFLGIHPPFPLWLFPLAFSASLALPWCFFYVLSENVISLFPCFSLLKWFVVSKTCWEHWRRETLDDLMLACLVDVQFDQLTYQQMIGRLTDTLMWLEMGTCISIHLSIHPSHLFTLSLYLSSITICLSSSITIYLSSLSVCLSIISLSSSGMGDADIFQASVCETGGKIEFLP